MRQVMELAVEGTRPRGRAKQGYGLKNQLLNRNLIDKAEKIFAQTLMQGPYLSNLKKNNPVVPELKPKQKST